jgi:hypothetical protein
VSEPLGVIRNISTARAMLDLVVFDDGIVVARGSLRSAVRTMADAGVFRAGRVAVDAMVRPDRGAPPSDREAMLASDPSAELIPFASVTTLRLKRGWFGNGRLEVVGLDGSTRTFDWKKLYNDFDEVEALLRRAAPLKVVRA